MTVQDVLDIYEAEDSYVSNSMVNKSYDDNGCTYKWLARAGSKAFRREVFMCTTGTGTLTGRTAVEYIEIDEAK